MGWDCKICVFECPREKGRKRCLGKALRPMPSEVHRNLPEISITVVATCQRTTFKRSYAVRITTDQNIALGLYLHLHHPTTEQTLLDGFSFHLCLKLVIEFLIAATKIGNFPGMFQEKSGIFFAGSAFLTLPRVRNNNRDARRIMLLFRIICHKWLFHFPIWILK